MTITITGTPADWISNPSIGNGAIAGWSATSTVVAPGGSLSGFQLLAPGLPSIVEAFVVGDIHVDQLPNFPNGEAPESLPGSDITQNSLRVPTVGPVSPPLNITPLTFLATIVSFKEQAFALGWIANGGIKNSLDAKLNAAQAALNSGNSREAKNQLNALLNEVSAQAGKQLTSEAVALLQFNTQYLINQIP
jgi:hypothetical protein